MEQTANYGLNQWAAGDRILMEDFNADNVKTDQALAAEKTAREAALEAMQAHYPLVYLMRGAATEGATQIDLDVSGIDLTEYLELYINVRQTASGGAGYVSILVNGLTSGYLDSSGDATKIELFRGTINSTIGGFSSTITIGKGLKISNTAPILPSAVHTINLVGMSTSMSSATPRALASDMVVWLYGLKRC